MLTMDGVSTVLMIAGVSARSNGHRPGGTCSASAATRISRMWSQSPATAETDEGGAGHDEVGACEGRGVSFEETDKDPPKDRRPSAIAALGVAVLVGVDDPLKDARAHRSGVVPLEPSLAHPADGVLAGGLAFDVGLVADLAATIEIRERLDGAVGAGVAEGWASSGEIRAATALAELEPLRRRQPGSRRPCVTRAPSTTGVAGPSGPGRPRVTEGGARCRRHRRPRWPLSPGTSAPTGARERDSTGGTRACRARGRIEPASWRRSWR